MNPSIMSRHNPNHTARTSAFTLVEMLVVIGIIGILATLVVGLQGVAVKKRDHSKVSAMLKQLETAIESYKAKYGSYPPDNPNANALNTNSLFYELTGARYIPAVPAGNSTFESAYAPGNQIGSNTLYQTFGTFGIINAADAAAPSKDFLAGTLKAGNWGEIQGVGATVLVLLVPARSDVVATNLWFYRATPNSVKNPGTFDLWAVYVRGGTTNIVGNFK